jgi:putative transposase
LIPRAVLEALGQWTNEPPEIGGLHRGMARRPRVVVPGLPHPMPQRGNRRQRTFFKDEDYSEYRTARGRLPRLRNTSACLFSDAKSCPSRFGACRRLRLTGLVGEAHRRYTRTINVREGWKGHPWQERFHSFVMDKGHLIAAARYVERNPVRARLYVRPQD